MYTVYKHTNIFNGKVYIGLTKKKPYQRFRGGEGYKPKSKNHPLPFYNAIKFYGWKSFKHEIICTGLTKEEAEQMEIELISKYKSNDRDFGYNVDLGGNASGKTSDETRKKISDGWSLNKDERCRRISDGKKGVSFSEEHKKHLSESKIGKEAKNKRPVIQYTLDMREIKRYSSLEEAQNELNVCKANICRAIKYGRTAGGYKWSYCGPT